MMLQILLHQLFRQVASAPRTVPNRPEVFAPVSLPKFREFSLQDSRRPSLEPLHQIAQRLQRRILQVHVDVILTDHSAQNPHVLGVTDLNQKFPASLLNLTLQNVKPILCYPNHMHGQPANRMSPVSLLFHLVAPSTP
jgi:hypothetical protein